MSERDRVVLVTGGTKNLGRQIVVDFAAAGYRVAVMARDADGLDRLMGELDAEGTEALGLGADVTDAAAVERGVEAAIERFGQVDCLVHCAVLRSHSSFDELSADEFRRTVDVNLFGGFNVAKAVVPHMVARRSGSIIGMNGTTAYIGGRHPAMAASKAGFLGLYRSLAIELAPAGVRVNSLVFGWMETDKAVPPDPEERALELALTPRGSFGTPHEAAAACLFLASDAAGHITGQSLHLNGGRFIF